MESFGAKFPRVYNDSGFKGWFVSTLLLGRLDSPKVNCSRAEVLTRESSCLVRISGEWSSCGLYR